MRKLRQIESTTLHCCICLNQGESVPAFTVVKSYAVCEAHVALVSRKNFDIFDIHVTGTKASPA